MTEGVYSLFEVRPDAAGKLQRRRRARFHIHDAYVTHLEDLDDELSGVPEGPLTPESATAIRKLSGPHHQLVRWSREYGDDPGQLPEFTPPKPFVPEESGVVSRPPVFEYLRQGMSHPHTIEVRGDGVVLNGSTLSPQESMKILDNVRSGVGTLRYKRVGENLAKAGSHVWRIQNEAGEGPYRSEAFEPQDLEGEISEQKPHPAAEFENWKDIQDQGGVFGFERPEHAVAWFGHDALHTLKVNGFPLVKVPAERTWRAKSGRQVAFIPMIKKNESLIKMALIHDDDKNPLTVYRVQNEKGEGPYHAEGYKSQKSRVMSRQSSNRPGPSIDLEDDERARMVSRDQAMNDHHMFAFEKPEHVNDWFDPDQAKILQSKGFGLYAVPARRVWRSKSGRQVMFNRPGRWMDSDGREVAGSDEGVFHPEVGKDKKISWPAPIKKTEGAQVETPEPPKLDRDTTVPAAGNLEALASKEPTGIPAFVEVNDLWRHLQAGWTETDEALRELGEVLRSSGGDPYRISDDLFLVFYPDSETMMTGLREASEPERVLRPAGLDPLTLAIGAGRDQGEAWEQLQTARRLARQESGHPQTSVQVAQDLLKSEPDSVTLTKMNAHHTFSEQPFEEGTHCDLLTTTPPRHVVIHRYTPEDPHGDYLVRDGVTNLLIVRNIPRHQLRRRV